jgi:hypothetical protein
MEKAMVTCFTIDGIISRNQNLFMYSGRQRTNCFSLVFASLAFSVSFSNKNVDIGIAGMGSRFL